MNDQEFWEEYSKYKSSYKKEQALKKLFSSNDIVTLDRVCETLLTNKSQSLKHLLLEIAEVLESKFHDSPELQDLSHYQKYLKKEKLQNFKNYWYKKLQSTRREDTFRTLESNIQKRYDNQKSGKFSIGIEFEYSKNFYGHIMITCGRGMYKPYELSHLSYGYHTNLRSYQDGIINNQPFNQIHLGKKNYNPQCLSIVDDEFRFSDTIKNVVTEFYSYHDDIYSEFSKLTVDNFEDSAFLKSGFKRYFFANDIRLILGILNVQINEGNQDLVSEFAKKGIELDKHNHHTEYLQALIK